MASAMLPCPASLSQTAIITSGLALAASLRSLVEGGDGFLEIAVHLCYLAGLGMAGFLCFLNRPSLVTGAFVCGHLLGSLTNVLIHSRVLPSTGAARALFTRRLELFPDIILSIHTQVGADTLFMHKAPTIHARRPSTLRASSCPQHTIG